MSACRCEAREFPHRRDRHCEALEAEMAEAQNFDRESLRLFERTEAQAINADRYSVLESSS